MRKVLLVVCVLALVCTAAYASDSQWLISVKAVNGSFAGGAAVSVGLGGNTELVSNFAAASTGSVAAEKTVAYGDVGTAYHSRHDLPMVAGNEYIWDLKIGAKGGALAGGHIILWNNQLATGGVIGGALNSSLAYAFQAKVGETYQTLAWFSTQPFADASVGMFGDNAMGTWHDVSVLGKNVSNWTPSSANTGFYVDADLITGNGYADLADYRLVVRPGVVPEPGSLMALGSGLIGLAGFAIRRRK